MSESDDLRIGPMRAFERDRVLDRWREQFGLYSEAHTNNWIDAALDDDYASVRCFTVGSREELAGFLVLKRFPGAELDDTFPDVDTSGWPRAADNAQVYMVCVADDWKRRGVATHLVYRGHDHLREHGVGRAWAASWHRAYDPDSRALFRSCGYEQVGEQADFYRTGEGNPERDCPDCGSPCTCSASFWTTPVDAGDVACAECGSRETRLTGEVRGGEFEWRCGGCGLRWYRGT